MVLVRLPDGWRISRYVFGKSASDGLDSEGFGERLASAARGR
ncbi:hypothetical protein [Streptomyces sp. NRRL B-24572]|nr:hypothetical protein [Streptomyces sp. NRRL B-24572]